MLGLSLHLTSHGKLHDIMYLRHPMSQQYVKHCMKLCDKHGKECERWLVGANVHFQRFVRRMKALFCMPMLQLTLLA